MRLPQKKTKHHGTTKMSFTLTLFLLRLLGALLLLSFVGAVGWFMYQDMQLTAKSIAHVGQVRGRLSVVVSESGSPAIGTSYPLLVVTHIGRAQNNAVVLDDGFTSNQHALITWRGQQWWLEDLGSRNGTLLNGVSLEETAVVANGDLITIGTVQFELEL